MPIKKWIITLLTAALLFSFAGCSWNAADKDAVDSLRVGLITDSSPEDPQDAGQIVWEALQQLAATQPGMEVSIRTKQDGSFIECVRQLTDEGCGLIVSTAADGVAEAVAAAQSAPQQHFAVFSQDDLGLSNLCSLTFATEQAVYLAGYAAGKTTESGRIGCAYSRKTHQTEQYLAAFTAGVKAANKEAIFLSGNLLLRGDVRTAEEMIANGVDVIFHADGQAGSRVVSACQQNGIRAITVNTGETPAGAVLVSAQNDLAFAVTDLVQQTAQGAFPAGLRQYDLSGGVELAVNAAQLPETVKTSVETMKNRIAAGEVSIPAAQDADGDF